MSTLSALCDIPNKEINVVEARSGIPMSPATDLYCAFSEAYFAFAD
jgi:hypothetical protein